VALKVGVHANLNDHSIYKSIVSSGPKHASDLCHNMPSIVGYGQLQYSQYDLATKPNSSNAVSIKQSIAYNVAIGPLKSTVASPSAD
jgi:hypothetical protein